MRLADYVIDFIAQQGVKHVFMIPGGGAMHLNDALGRNEKLRYICNLHEQACSIAAEAYGQYTNNLGVAHVTTGPGGTNAITGIAAAWLDSTPTLFFAGQVKKADLKGSRRVRQIGFQEIDMVRLVEPITKYAATVMDPDSIRYHLEKALWEARSGRPGPVWIDIPLDVQAAQVDPNSLHGFTPPSFTTDGLEDAVRETIALLLQSERPAILAGNGVRLGNGIDDFYKLVEEICIPTLLTWKAIDFLAEDHRCYCGRPGGTGQRGANFTQQNADFLLTIGARLDAGQTAYNHSNFARAARKVVVDIDTAEIDKLQMQVDVPVPFDARLFIKELLRQLRGINLPDWSPWMLRSKNLHQRYPLCLPEYWNRSEFIDNYVFIEVLSDLMKEDDLLVPGSSGQCSEITMQAFKVKLGQRILNSEGLGPMGFGIAAPIGACLASGGRRTISIDGDGGIVMNVQELETLRRLNLPIKIFILNNAGYGSIRTSQRNYFDGFYVASEASSGLSLPSFKGVADSYGIPFFKIENHLQLRSGVSSVLSSKGPALCELMIFPDQATKPRVTSKQLSDGTLTSVPMEDMTPFLEREEFDTNMIIPSI